MNKEKWPQGDLTDKEYQELLALEYVLTWGYSDKPEEDENRYRYLSNKNWESIYGKD